MEKELKDFAYRIPDKFFRPYTVTRPFHARVAYYLEEGKPVIQEIAFSENCLDYISGTHIMKKDLKEKLETHVRTARLIKG